jgi:predicted ArsR family transcriptional regulator
MKTTVTWLDFKQAFIQYGRDEQFSYDGLKIIFDYLEELEQDCGQEIELDVIAICCDFSEDHWRDIAADYSIELDENKDEEEQQEQVLDYLADEGVFIGISGDLIVYRQF